MPDLNDVRWPAHDFSLHIQHNLHKFYHETVEEGLTGDNQTYDRDDFPDEAEILTAIAADSVWTIQWYPLSSVGFKRVSAATLERALAYAVQGER
jgi:hypothetical protein